MKACSGPARKRQPRPRDAFTLVELLVALVLVAIALLALSATTALVVRELAGAAARSTAGMALRNRVERFLLLPCATAASAEAVQHGVRERWQTTAVDSAASLRDSVSLMDRRRERAVVVEARRQCD